MNYRSVWIVLTAVLVSLSPFMLKQVLADEAPAAAPAAAPAQEDLMNEEQLAEMLINVLGLAPMLPPNPQPTDVFGILLQNGISPKDGWNPTNNVTIGNLARILVQSMGAADKIENPDDDKSWVDYLKSIGIEFGTIEEAIDQTEVIPDPVALQAVEASTDPLRKVPSIRPVDEQQLGADLQTFRRLVSRADIVRTISQIPTPQPPTPEPSTPN